MNALVTIIIPTYNRATLLRRAVQSVVDQTFGNWELIVVDDGSTDNTEEVVASFMRRDHRVRYIKQKNAWSSAARNTGIAASSGLYIALLDSDDYWHASKLERQIERMETGPSNLGVVFCNTRIVDRDNNLRFVSRYDREGDIHKLLLRGNFVGGSASSVLIKRQCLDYSGPFEEDVRGSEDWLLWLIIAERYEYACVPEFLVTLLIDPTVESNQSIFDSLENRLRCVLLYARRKTLMPGDMALMVESALTDYGIASFDHLADKGVRVASRAWWAYYLREDFAIYECEAQRMRMQTILERRYLRDVWTKRIRDVLGWPLRGLRRYFLERKYFPFTVYRKHVKKHLRRWKIRD